VFYYCDHRPLLNRGGVSQTALENSTHKPPKNFQLMFSFSIRIKYA
jgi:hypothetical protein